MRPSPCRRSSRPKARRRARRACSRSRSRRRTGCGRGPSASGTSTPICQKCGSSSRAVGPSAALVTLSSRSASTRSPLRCRICRARCLTCSKSAARETKMCATANAGSSARRGACPPARTSSCQISARDVDHRAAAVALAVDVAGPVQHLLEGDEALLDHIVSGAAVLADGRVERAGVLVLDRLGTPQRPVGLGGRVVIAALLSRCGRVLLGQLRRMSAHLSSRVPRLLRAGARRVRGRRNYSPRAQSCNGSLDAAR